MLAGGRLPGGAAGRHLHGARSSVAIIAHIGHDNPRVYPPTRFQTNFGFFLDRVLPEPIAAERSRDCGTARHLSLPFPLYIFVQ